MQQLTEVLDSIAAGLIIIDRDHRVEWMNKKALEWLGPFVEIGKRRRCYRTIVYSKGFCEICPTGKTIDHGTATHYEFNLPSNIPPEISESGSPAAFEIIGIPIFDKHRRVSRVVELILDVTEKGIEKIRSEELMAFYAQEMDKRSRFQYNMTETIQEQKAGTSLKRAREFMLEMKKLLPEFKRGDFKWLTSNHSKIKTGYCHQVFVTSYQKTMSVC